MCGIAGFLGQGDATDLARMLDSLRQRGPDAGATFVDQANGFYLGHRRLQVVDIAGGAQPMQSPDGETVISYNGEIYNATELRRELEVKGHKFSSDHSATEVLLHGYREWGEALASKLNGMWAFAIWDRARRRLLLSRDRFGQKPLYYTQQGSAFVFASELSALLRHAAVARQLSPLALQKYHAHGFFPAAHTPYQGVYKVLAGTNLTYASDSLAPNISRYWAYRLEPEAIDRPSQVEQWSERLRATLAAAVRRHLVADVPLGVFLSGGLDSTAVAYFAQQATAEPLQTFGLGFQQASFDESVYAAEAAAFVGSRHRQTVLTAEHLPELTTALFERLDIPLSDSSLLSYFALCRLARQHVTVALGGDAADELFAGYDTFKSLRYAAWLNRLLPKSLHRGIVAAIARLPQSHTHMPLKFKLLQGLKAHGQPAALWHSLWLAPLTLADIKELQQQPTDLEALYSEAIEIWERSVGASPLERSLQFYGELFLTDQILVKTDRLSMAHGLEVRTPFLDNEVVELARRLPTQLKLHAGQGKFILKRAMAPILPAALVWRKKIGFSAPLAEWLQAGAIDVEAVAPPHSPIGKLARRYLQLHRQGHGDQRLPLWNLYVWQRYNQLSP